MQKPTLTQETWAEAAQAVGLRYEVLATATGKSFSTVYRYANGSRRPSEEWLAQVSAIVAAEAARRAA